MRYLFIFFLIAIIGCQTTSLQKKESPDAARSETPQDVRSAIESVAGAVSQGATRIKYCPVCGRRFSPSVTQCPDDGAALKDLE